MASAARFGAMIVARSGGRSTLYVRSLRQGTTRTLRLDGFHGRPLLQAGKLFIRNAQRLLVVTV